ncbi:unnamed protein product [Enterobius vermicularis]|uniref:Bursicon n=1 Tax=Enterobius vermicularis TaxID=51028 RepID=A0A0N4V2H7_ENTVE|nr:unnamed protein product [Enterobius vermicularis]
MAKIVSGLPVRLISSVMKKSSSNLKSGRSNRTKISTNIVLLFCLLARLSYADSASLKVDCRKYGNRHVIAEDGCQPVMVQLNVCSGFCRTFSFYDIDSEKVTVIGKCCRMVENIWVNVTLNCSDGHRVVRLPSATECRCFDCAADR